MIVFTPAERAAARAFLDEREAEFAALPLTSWIVPVYIHHARHLCKVLGKSVSFEMKEVCQDSPGMLVLLGKTRREPLPGIIYAEGQQVPVGMYDHVPAGRFTWIYREGKCPDCKITARSGSGRLTDAALRPPLGRS